ncbi:hypothetical protein K503DRAFT_775508 [Rhizopogon vinicolor AM-OR11-026]|uniref:Uncharacterized protein n=1 Tax=Rhizopogon vinicolor AM-OR11-026 TaxID=1314800 RepID=A0A1B7MLQ2_9AGAM|nr:hypothetical protein K503DRAFT_775508 [Rhizopogon vinicolor AM-OR11-026]
MFPWRRVNCAMLRRVLPAKAMAVYVMKSLILLLLHRTPIHNKRLDQRQSTAESMEVAGRVSASRNM